jgi:enterochelin esterase family protein
MSRDAGTVVVETVDLAALAGNPLGDPATREVPVYLPPGYDADRERRYPTIYWLHGFTGIGLSAVARSLWVPSLPEVMDRVIAAGAPPAILVMADGATRYGGSQWLNSPATGRYEDAVGELISRIDRGYRTLASPEHRGVSGKSSGGYGALVLGMRRPDWFGAIGSHSGDAYFEACYKPFFWRSLGVIRKHGGLAGFLAAFDAMAKKPREATEALVAVVAMAMAYSGNPDGSYDLPIDLESGELRAEVWARWLAWDPVSLVARHADALRRMKLVYFECGLRDEWNIQYGARILHRRMTALGIAHEHQEFDDDHGSVNYRYGESLGRICRAIG